MKTAKKLNLLRGSINSIDRKIVKLLDGRLLLAEKIAVAKDDMRLPLTDLDREFQISKILKSKTKSPILRDCLDDIFSNIFQISKAVRLLKKSNKISFKKVGIIGIGLIGGSIISALRAKNPDIQICTIGKSEIADVEFRTLPELLKNIELLIVATPLDTVIPIAKSVAKNGKLLKRKIIVMDVSSVRTEITKEFCKLSGPNIEFVSTHPMSGSEKSGFKNRKTTLFVNNPWIITPHRKNSEKALKKVSELIKFLGGRVEILAPKEHDEIMAQISHILFLLSSLLFAFAKNKTLIKLCGPGFRTMTRLAGGNPEMHSQIFNSNTKNIEKALSSLITFIKKQKPNRKNSLKFFKKIKSERDKL